MRVSLATAGTAAATATAAVVEVVAMGPRSRHQRWRTIVRDLQRWRTIVRDLATTVGHSPSPCFPCTNSHGRANLSSNVVSLWMFDYCRVVRAASHSRPGGVQLLATRLFARSTTPKEAVKHTPNQSKCTFCARLLMRRRTCVLPLNMQNMKAFLNTS